MTHQQTLQKILGFEKFENEEEKEDAWRVRKVRMAIRSEHESNAVNGDGPFPF